MRGARHGSRLRGPLTLAVLAALGCGSVAEREDAPLPDADSTADPGIDVPPDVTDEDASIPEDVAGEAEGATDSGPVPDVPAEVEASVDVDVAPDVVPDTVTDVREDAGGGESDALPETIEPVECRDESDCDEYLTCCNNRCVNTNYDPENCGACDLRCAPAAPFCDMAECTERPCDDGTPACPGGTVCCGALCCAAEDVCCIVADGSSTNPPPGCYAEHCPGLLPGGG